MRAGKVLVVATSPARHALARPVSANGRPPTIQDAGALCFEAIQIDPMIQDLRDLARVNRLLDRPSTGNGPEPARSARSAYRPIDYAFAGPEVRGLLGLAAETVLGTQFSGVQGLLHPDLKALSFLLGTGVNRGELLSYLFFEPAFIERAIELGMDDANRMVARSDGEIWERNSMP
jgi:NTE family protein